MADATLKIPAEYAEAFYREAVDTLLYASDRLESEDMPRMNDAISLLERARRGELEFEAEELVKSTIEGLLLNLGERMHGLAEDRSTDKLREAMAELRVWLALLDSEPMQEVERQREAQLEELRRREAEREGVA